MRVTSITDCVLVAVEPSVRMPEMMLDEGPRPRTELNRTRAS
jgi:hypothetical protein